MEVDDYLRANLIHAGKISMAAFWYSLYQFASVERCVNENNKIGMESQRFITFLPLVFQGHLFLHTQKPCTKNKSSLNPSSEIHRVKKFPYIIEGFDKPSLVSNVEGYQCP